MILRQDVAGFESSVFNFGNASPLLRWPPDRARIALGRRGEEVGVEPQSADEGRSPVEGMRQLMDGEAAVADEDDVAAGQPAAELERPWRAQSVSSLCLRPRWWSERSDGASRVKTGRAFTSLPREPASAP